MKAGDQCLKIVEWSEEDQYYAGTCPGVMRGGIHGDDKCKVYKERCEIVEEWIAIHQEDGDPLPAATAGKKYSGKFIVRVGNSYRKKRDLGMGQNDEIMGRVPSRGLEMNHKYKSCALVLCTFVLAQVIPPSACGIEDAVGIGQLASEKKYDDVESKLLELSENASLDEFRNEIFELAAIEKGEIRKPGRSTLEYERAIKIGNILLKHNEKVSGKKIFFMRRNLSLRMRCFVTIGVKLSLKVSSKILSDICLTY